MRRPALLAIAAAESAPKAAPSGRHRDVIDRLAARGWEREKIEAWPLSAIAIASEELEYQAIARSRGVRRQVALGYEAMLALPEKIPPCPKCGHKESNRHGWQSCGGVKFPRRRCRKCGKSWSIKQNP